MSQMIAFSILSNLVFCSLEFRSLNSIWSKQFANFLDEILCPYWFILLCYYKIPIERWSITPRASAIIKPDIYLHIQDLLRK